MRNSALNLYQTKQRQRRIKERHGASVGLFASIATTFAAYSHPVNDVHHICEIYEQPNRNGKNARSRIPHRLLHTPMQYFKTETSRKLKKQANKYKVA